MEPRRADAGSPHRRRTPAHGFVRMALLGLALFSPFLVGVSVRFGRRLSEVAIGATLVLLGVVWVMFGSPARRARVIGFAIVSCVLSVTLVDVIARPLVNSTRFPGSTVAWPPMPLVRRYLPNARFEGVVHGAWAEARGLRGYRENHRISFVTDRYGFRNAGPLHDPIDIIALGDSYTSAHNVTQDAAWPATLSRRYGLHVYNLAVADAGPWHELINLMLEVDRLRIKPGRTVVLWNLFTANDLAVACYPIFRTDELPWRTGLGRLASELSAFRSQSPLDRSLARAMEHAGLASQDPSLVVKKFVDGTGMIFYTGFAREADRSLADIRRDPNYDCLRRTISAMRRFADSRRLAVAIIVSPPSEEVYSWVLRGAPPWSTAADPSGFVLAVREMARENQIPFLDLKPPLVEASKRVYQESRHLLWARDDAHWNADGNLEVAKIAYQFYTAVQSRPTGGVQVPGIRINPISTGSQRSMARASPAKSARPHSPAGGD